MLKKFRIMFVMLLAIAGLMVTFGGTAYAGTGPSVWQFGNSGDTCTGTGIFISPSSQAKMDCIYYEDDSTFQLGATGVSLQFKPSGGGNLIGWYDPCCTSTSSYWFTSHTTSGPILDYDLILQHDCNIVLYQRGYTDALHAVWAVGSNTSDPNNTNCRIRLLRNSSNKPYFVVEYYDSGHMYWYTQCAVPNGSGPGVTYPATCNTGPRNT